MRIQKIVDGVDAAVSSLAERDKFSPRNRRRMISKVFADSRKRYRVTPRRHVEFQGFTARGTECKLIFEVRGGRVAWLHKGSTGRTSGRILWLSQEEAVTYGRGLIAMGTKRERLGTWTGRKCYLMGRGMLSVAAYAARVEREAASV